jgi:hypothetical protein
VASYLWLVAARWVIRQAEIFVKREGDMRQLFAVVIVALILWVAVGAIRQFGLWGNTCPSCGSTEDMLPIVYGFPTHETMERAKQGRVILGGCVVSPDSPKWHCQRCGTEWGRDWLRP